MGVDKSQIKIKMQRVKADGSVADLAEGGTVSASYWEKYRDRAVMVTIENQPSYFTAMSLIEFGDIPGSIFVKPKPYYKNLSPNHAVIFPRELKQHYFYNISEQAIPGEFDLSLLKMDSQIPVGILDSTTAHAASEYFDFQCVRQQGGPNIEFTLNNGYALPWQIRGMNTCPKQVLGLTKSLGW
jgi:hypothetical protein